MAASASHMSVHTRVASHACAHASTGARMDVAARARERDIVLMCARSRSHRCALEHRHALARDIGLRTCVRVCVCVCARGRVRACERALMCACADRGWRAPIPQPPPLGGGGKKDVGGGVSQYQVSYIKRQFLIIPDNEV